MSLIIDGPKDERSYEWLKAQFTPDEIAAAVVQVEATGRKAYISNVTKALGTRIPPEVWGMQPQEFNAIREKLRAMRNEFAAKAAASKEV
jgi:hypothetical protein